MSFKGINYLNYVDLPDDHPFRGLTAGWIGFFDPETLMMVGYGHGQGIAHIFSHEQGGWPFVGLDGPLEIEGHMFDLDAMEFVRRPDMGVWLDGDTLRGIPPEASLRIDATYYEVTDSEIKLVAPPGRALEINVELIPYRTYRVKYASPEN